VITHCESLRDRFAIIDAAQGESNVSTLNPRSSWDTKYAAFYYPWLKVYDPLSKTYKLAPPGGHVAGIYARSDAERGVHKAPANEVVRGAVDLEFAITKGEQDILNPRGVNCIRAFPGRGIRVWGARTLSSDALWKYVNVRRLFLFIEESVDEGTQWVVFEPNDEKLWARIRQSITEFLTRVWRDGALMGKTPEEAFFVKCDRTTMTQDDIDNGRLICLIGVAPVKPAEFVIFRIAQWQGGSAVSE
jgi:phage tail sheath protein FI